MVDVNVFPLPKTAPLSGIFKVCLPPTFRYKCYLKRTYLTTLLPLDTSRLLCCCCCCCVSRSVVSHSLRPHNLYSSWSSPGQNTGMGSFSLLQGIFPTQGSHPGLQHWRRILYQLSRKGSTRLLEWVAYPFSSGSSQPRNWTRVPCIAGRFFTN